MSALDITVLGAERGSTFYFRLLEYGQFLWLQKLPARAILCLDRAMGADVQYPCEMVERWPIPYAALAWFLQHRDESLFWGNPRIHFQHFADRLGEPRRQLRRWRAWACWQIVRCHWPELPRDDRHRVQEPLPDEIHSGLCAHGLPGEVEIWRSACNFCEIQVG